MSTEHDAIYRAVYNSIPTTGDLKEVIHHGVQDAFPDVSQILEAIAVGVGGALPHRGQITDVIGSIMSEALPDDEDILRVICEGCDLAFRRAIPTQGEILEAIQQGVYDAVMSRLSSG